MSDGGDKPKQPEKARQKQRLAAALRDNLRRRKAQARGRGTSAADKPEPKSTRDR